MSLSTKARWEQIHNADRPAQTKSLGKDSLFCIHRGEEQVEIVACGSCGLKAPAFNCYCPSVNTSRCITTGDERIRSTAREIGYAVCSECPFRQAFDPDELDQEIRSANTSHDIDWNKQPEIINAYKRFLREAVHGQTKQFFPENPQQSGRGIVTIAGGVRYFTAVYVLLYHLQQLGCTLPVEVWYMGPLELDNRMAELLAEFPNVYLVDALTELESRNVKPRCFGPWECKAFALQYSRFAETLFIDADNCPTINPETLFDCPEYKSSGAIFWPDLPPMGYDITETAFEVCGLPVPGRYTIPGHHNPTDYRPVESGQLLIDKQRPEQQDALQLCMLLNSHSDFFYPSQHRGRPNWHIYGDKSTFYLAWNMKQTPYRMPQQCTFAGNDNGGGFQQYNFSGEIVFQHRCQPVSKYNLHGRNIHPEGWLNPEWIDQALAQLREKWKPSIIYPHLHNATDGELAAKTVGQWVLFSPENPQLIELRSDGRTSHGRTWAIRSHGSQRLLVFANQNTGELVLGLDREGYSWCNHRTKHFLRPYPERSHKLNIPLNPPEVGIWEEIHLRNGYKLPDRFDSEDVILDIGGHVGLFAWECLQRGAGYVVTVEPNLTSLATLQTNLADYRDKLLIVPAAAWGRFEILALHPGRSAIEAASYPIKDNQPLPDPRQEQKPIKPVVGLPFTEILNLCPKRPRLIKIDCEGAEYPILESCPVGLLNGIELVGEWHGWNGENYTPERIRQALLWAADCGAECVSVTTHEVDDHLGYFHVRPLSKNPQSPQGGNP